MGEVRPNGKGKMITGKGNMVLGRNLHSDGVHEVRYNSRCRILQSRQARLFEKWTELEWQSDAWFLVRVQKWLPGRSFTFSSLCNELVQTPATFQIHMPGTPCGIDAFFLLNSTFLSQKPLMRRGWRRSRTRTSRWGEGHRRSCSNGPDGGYGTR